MHMTDQHLQKCLKRYNDVTMSSTAYEITGFTIVYSTVYLDADQRKRQSSASLAFVRGIHRWPVNSPQKWPVTRKMFPFDDVIMNLWKSLTCLLERSQGYLIAIRCYEFKFTLSSFPLGSYGVTNKNQLWKAWHEWLITFPEIMDLIFPNLG